MVCNSNETLAVGIVQDAAPGLDEELKDYEPSILASPVSWQCMLFPDALRSLFWPVFLRS